MKHRESAALDKLIRLNTYSPTVVNEVHRIAITTGDCKGVLSANELRARGILGNPDVEAGDLADTKLARLIESSPKICSAFLGRPLLSEIEPAALAVLASIADVRPNDRGVPVTRDSSFAYVAALVLDEAGTTTKDRLMRVFIRRLVDINAKVPHLVAMLRDATTREDYRDLVADLDSWLDQLAVAVTSPRFPSEDVGRFIAACDQVLRGKADRGLLYETPRLSQIPREFTRSFPVQQSQDAEVAAGSGTESLIQRARQTKNVFDAILANSGAELERTVQLRLDAAKEFLARRQFVKAQMLEFGWPQLAARARAASGMRRLRNLEKAVLDPGRQYKFDPYWRRLLADERLVDFLAIPPYFNDISAEEFAGIAEEFTGISDVEDGAPVSETNASVPDGDRVEFSQYSDIELIFSPLPGVEPAQPGYVPAQFELKVKRGNEEAPTNEEAPIEVPAARIRELLVLLERAYHVSYRQDQDPYPSGGRPAIAVTTDSFPSPDDVLEEIGNALWNAIMATAETEGIRRLFDSAIADEEHLRLIFTNKQQALADMPWECLYIPVLRVAAGLTVKISVVRNITDPVSLVPRSIGRPLRILIVSSTPADLPWINADQEVALLQRALSPAERAGLVRLEILVDPDEKELQHRLRVVRPHIFHFIGHGAVQPDGEGVVALADEDKKAVFVTASRFGTILRDHGILLSTLNSCFSGGETDFDMARSIARILVQHGVPVAIATAREVLDRAALQFAREFYIALIDGYPIEAAVVEARKLLSVKGWDWSAYVLYASADSSLLEFRVSSSG